MLTTTKQQLRREFSRFKPDCVLTYAIDDDKSERELLADVYQGSHKSGGEPDPVQGSITVLFDEAWTEPDLGTITLEVVGRQKVVAIPRKPMCVEGCFVVVFDVEVEAA